MDAHVSAIQAGMRRAHTAHVRAVCAVEHALVAHVRDDVLAAVAGFAYVISYVRHLGNFCRADNAEVRGMGAHAVQAE